MIHTTEGEVIREGWQRWAESIPDDTPRCMPQEFWDDLARNPLPRTQPAIPQWVYLHGDEGLIKPWYECRRAKQGKAETVLL